VLAAFAAISGAVDLPFDYYRQFVLEAKLRLQPHDAAIVLSPT
jgi:hypothetical protein